MPVAYNPHPNQPVIPHLVVEDIDKEIAFLSRAFGAKEEGRFQGPDGKIMHAVVSVEGQKFFLGPVMDAKAAPYRASFYHYVKDADAVFRAAIAGGGASVLAVADQFWGDRSGLLRDPAGNTWWIATHIEDVPPEEIGKRAQKAMHQARAASG